MEVFKHLCMTKRLKNCSVLLIIDALDHGKFKKNNFIWRLLMKNLFSKSLPILFLVISLSFMTFFHHEDELSDREVDEFETLNNQDHTVDPRSETEVEYTTTSDGEVV